jgi:hypothetical protein
MVSFFGDRDSLYAIGDGFDLIGGRLSDITIADIYEEITNLEKEHPDDRRILLTRELLLTLLGDHEEAIQLLKGTGDLEQNPFSQFRIARHLGALGKHEEMNNLLARLITKQDTPGDQLIAFLAAGTLDKKSEAVHLWKKIIETEDLVDLIIDDDVLEYPDDFSCLLSLPIGFSVIGLEILQKYNIRENYEVEIYAFVYFIKIMLDCITDHIYQTLTDEGPYEALPGFIVAEAIADEGYSLASKFFSFTPIHNTAIDLHIHTNLNEIKKYTSEYSIGKKLIESLNTDAIHDPQFLSHLREETGGNEFQIFEMLLHLRNTGLSDLIMPLIEEMEKTNSNIRMETHEQSRMRNALWDYTMEGRYTRNDPEDNLQDTLKQLWEKGDNTETFEFLSGHIRAGRLLSESSWAYFLAGKLGRFDELTDLLPMYKEKKMNEIVYLLEGYQHLMQKDLKPGLNLIERSIQAGLYEPIAMVLLARFLNKAGYPKRTIGICEKLLKKSFLKATEVYPILVEAYRMQGKEKEAAAVEERYKDCL